MNKEERKVPELRFKGFHDDWEQRKLEQISDKVTEKNKQEIFKEVLTNSAEFGIVSQESYFDKEIANVKNISGYYIVRPNDFVYNPRISNFAPVGPIKRNTLFITGIMSPLYYVFRTKNISTTYLQKYFESTHWHRFMYMNGDSGARSDRFAIKDTTFNEMPIPYPVFEEQKSIANFISKLDKIITLHQRKLNLLVSIKDAIIERVLPKDSSLYPTLRFNTFEMEWEKSKLGELVNIKTGKLDANEMVENGKYDFYTSGIQKYKINQYAFEGPAITIAGNGATVGHMHYADGFFNAYQRTYVLSDFSANREFLFQAISVSLPSKIRREARTGNIPYIVLDMLASLDLKLPSINEQEKIGYLLEQVKKIIDLHADKSQVLDNIKKLYLHKMFL